MFSFFFFNDTATTEIYTLSLHDALPIYIVFFLLIFFMVTSLQEIEAVMNLPTPQSAEGRDRKSTRLNSSHDQISYAVFCLKKKKKNDDKNYIYIFIVEVK